MQDYDFVLGMYSDTNYLTKELTEKFFTKYIKVKTFNDFNKVDLSKFNYLIINLIDSKNINFDDFKSILNLKCKILVLLPYFVADANLLNYETFIKNLLKLNLNLSILLIPEIVGEGVTFNQEYVSHNIIRQSSLSDRLKVEDKQILLVSLNKLSDEIVKQTLTFGMASKKTLILGFEISSKTLLTKYLKFSQSQIIQQSSSPDRTHLKPDIVLKLNFSLRNVVLKTKKYFLKQDVLNVKQKLNFPTKSKKIEFKGNIFNILFQKVKPFIIISICLYLTPVLMILLSIALLFASSKLIFKNRSVAVNLLNTSISISTGINNYNLGSPVYSQVSGLVLRASTIIKEGTDLFKIGNKLVVNILGSNFYNLEAYSDEISAGLDKIYYDIGFLQSEIESKSGFIEKNVNFLLNINQLELNTLKSKIYYSKMLVSRMTDILGWNKPKKFMIIFQNNMEIRPTGGFIGSFAILTFDKGRISEMVVHDVYSADGQLKGHVTPPVPIQKYLKEGNWYLRDANWDPDFSASARKISWFIEKEMDERVDGVIGIDLNFVKDLLRLTGPITLVDYDKKITSENIYLTTQEEVEKNFFPGSSKKQNFLTALLRNLIFEIESLPEDKYLILFKEIYKNLEERHIQIYFEDTNSQEAINNLKFSGNVDIASDCGTRCYLDYYGVVDANLGVNKSNLFITRSHDLNVSLDKAGVGHELILTYNNNAGMSLSESGIYKTYTRLIVPIESQILGIRVYNEEGLYNDIDYDSVIYDNRQEIGFYLEVYPQKINKVQIVWKYATGKLLQGGEYKLFIRKQAGTFSDNLNLQIEGSGFVLTQNSKAKYNTNLLKDFNTTVFLKPNKQ